MLIATSADSKHKTAPKHMEQIFENSYLCTKSQGSLQRCSRLCTIPCTETFSKRHDLPFHCRAASHAAIRIDSQHALVDDRAALEARVSQWQVARVF